MAAKCERDGCSNPPKSKRARFCDVAECVRARARVRRRKSDRDQRPDVVDEELGGDRLRMAGGVFAATLDELATAGRVHTAAGQQALRLATRIDFSAADTGSSVASLGKQHLAALAEALRDAEQADDPVDELTQRRRKRASA